MRQKPKRQLPEQQSPLAAQVPPSGLQDGASPPSQRRMRSAPGWQSPEQQSASVEQRPVVLTHWPEEQTKPEWQSSSNGRQPERNWHCSVSAKPEPAQALDAQELETLAELHGSPAVVCAEMSVQRPLLQTPLQQSCAKLHTSPTGRQRL